MFSSFVALCATALQSSPDVQALPVIAFVDVTVIPMDREGSLEHQTVIVRGERISSVGPVSEATVPEDATVIDGRGRYLMPGLVDMHVHAWFEEELALFLANGVTTVRNMFGAPLHVDWRERIEAGLLEGPTIVTAGPIVDGSPPYWPGSREITSPDDARAAVREHVEGNYDFVKVYSGVELDAYAALLRAAKEAGLAVDGHVPEAVGLGGALARGQRTIEHLFGIEDCLGARPAPAEGEDGAGAPEARSSPPAGGKRGATDFIAKLESWQDLDLERLPALAAEVKAAGAWNCPTLVVMQKMLLPEELEAEHARPYLRFVSAQSIAAWKQMDAVRPLAFTKAARAGHAGRLAVVRGLSEAGAPILLGTDTGNPWVAAGFAVHEELAYLAEALSSPYAALRAGTRAPAECLDAASEFGAVAPGLRADLLLLEADPLLDVANAARRVGMMVRGQWLLEEELQAGLEQLAAKHDDRR